MTPEELIRLKFASGNSVPVDRITITRKEYEQFLSQKIDQSVAFKTIHYKGQDIIVPKNSYWIAVTRHGFVKTFNQKPELFDFGLDILNWAFKYHRDYPPDTGYIVGHTNLNGEDWRNTLEKFD